MLLLSLRREETLSVYFGSQVEGTGEHYDSNGMADGAGRKTAEITGHREDSIMEFSCLSLSLV